MEKQVARSKCAANLSQTLFNCGCASAGFTDTSKPSRCASAIEKGLAEISSTLASRNFSVKVIMSDGEGGAGSVVKELIEMGIEVDISGAGGHVARIERRIRTIFPVYLAIILATQPPTSYFSNPPTSSNRNALYSTSLCSTLPILLSFYSTSFRPVVILF